MMVQSVLILLLSLTLIPVCQGQAYSMVVWLIVLLIASNVGYMLDSIYMYGSFVDPEQ